MVDIPTAKHHGVCPVCEGPRNVLIELPDGSQTVRPFRGLRRPPEEGERR